MKRKIIFPIIHFCLAISLIVLISFPNVKMVFAIMPEDEIVHLPKYYSCFSMIPFGYGHIGPLFIAISSCFLFILLVAYTIKRNRKLLRVLISLSIFALVSALVFSLTSILFNTFILMNGVVLFIILLLLIFFVVEYRMRNKLE